MDFLSTLDNDKGLQLQVENRKKTIKFDTGDPIVDWYSYMKYIANSEDVDVVNNSSTIDHWLDDKDDYFFMYLEGDFESIPQGDKRWDTMDMDEIMNLMRFVAKKPMTTFAEIKEHCKGKVK